MFHLDVKVKVLDRVMVQLQGNGNASENGVNIQFTSTVLLKEAAEFLAKSPDIPRATCFFPIIFIISRSGQIYYSDNSQNMYSTASFPLSSSANQKNSGYWSLDN